jgi:hypothetical protein
MGARIARKPRLAVLPGVLRSVHVALGAEVRGSVEAREVLTVSHRRCLGVALNFTRRLCLFSSAL